MPVQRTSCVHRGNTFYGEVTVTGAGPAMDVGVRYNGDEMRVRADGRSAETVAQALLRELVVLEAVRTKVAQGTAGAASINPGSDAAERRTPRAA